MQLWQHHKVNKARQCLTMEGRGKYDQFGCSLNLKLYIYFSTKYTHIYVCIHDTFHNKKLKIKIY